MLNETFKTKRSNLKIHLYVYDNLKCSIKLEIKSIQSTPAGGDVYCVVGFL